MKFFAFLLFSVSLFAGIVPAPDLLVDGQTVVSPGIGAAVVPNGTFQMWQICLNDNPSTAPTNDHDFNDACTMATFGPSNVLTLSYDGALTAAVNFVGVWGQLGWVGPGFPTHNFTYTPGVETIFAGYVNGGLTAIYLSGSAGPLNRPAGDYFYAQCILCPNDGEDVVTPEPSAFVLSGLGLAGLALATSRRRGC